VRIEKKRIRKLEANLLRAHEGALLVASFPVDEVAPGRLQRVGFTSKAEVGERVLPSALGPASRYNAHGGTLVHRGQPMETVYRQIEWTWIEWHGRDRVEKTDFRDVPYKRYPRTRVPPPAIELSIASVASGQNLVVAPPFEYRRSTAANLMLSINLVLELFGACDILDQDLVPILAVPAMRVNWTILPKGKMPWETLKPHLDEVIGRQKPMNRKIAEHRLKVITRHGPEFAAVGRGGFAGYVVFGFPTKSLFILECVRYGNATYVLDRDWEILSQMTKAEILNNAYHKARFIHVDRWEARVARLLASARQA